MLEPSQLLAFIAASALLTVTPGPDVLATISIGLARGWRPAVSFGVGCGLGCLLHTAAAVLGTAAILQSSPVAYTAMKMLGGGYLAWLGTNILRSTFKRPPTAAVSRTERTADSPQNSPMQPAATTTALQPRDFLRGLVANATNPKVAIFFLSFLPSFVRPDAARPELQLTLLGAAFTLQAVLIFALIGFFSGQFGRLLQNFPGLPLWLDRLCGLLFLMLAAMLLTSNASLQ
ncbi:MAG: hypothetical protein RLZZ436_807 [Planctomycetota bacterium]|jgi:threonine/homoserine/homoserine lactone efflux protein